MVEGYKVHEVTIYARLNGGKLAKPLLGFLNREFESLPLRPFTNPLPERVFHIFSLWRSTIEYCRPTNKHKVSARRFRVDCIPCESCGMLRI